MALYERASDAFINTDGEHFSMRDSASDWHRRAESFDTLFGYAVFARRLEFCLRGVSDVSTEGREGMLSLFADLADYPHDFENVKEKIKGDLGAFLRESRIADCGAGTGSVLSFIEWADLPYPQQLTLLEPNPNFYKFIKDRIESSDGQGPKNSLNVLSKVDVNVHGNSEYVVYEVWDKRSGDMSEIQVINDRVEASDAPPISKEASLVLVGVSKYFSAEEFKSIVDVAGDALVSSRLQSISFNTQGTGDVIPRVTHLERGLYRMLKRFHQIKISGRPNLHHFYSRGDLAWFGDDYSLTHNYGNSIIVTLK